MEGVRIELLGRFRVRRGEHEIAEADWPARRAQELVQLLALADGRRLPRDQVIEQLWPHLGADAGAANLRKAAHHARRTLGDDDAIVLRSGRVELLPGREVAVDVAEFLSCADPARCPGELLPDAPYETWAQEPRRRVQEHLTQLLRANGAWERLMEVDPTDEAACRELMRAAIAEGRRHVAIRWYERLRIAMLRELGVAPGAMTISGRICLGDIGSNAWVPAACMSDQVARKYIDISSLRVRNFDVEYRQNVDIKYNGDFSGDDSLALYANTDGVMVDRLRFVKPDDGMGVEFIQTGAPMTATHHYFAFEWDTVPGFIHGPDGGLDCPGNTELYLLKRSDTGQVSHYDLPGPESNDLIYYIPGC